MPASIISMVVETAQPPFVDVTGREPRAMVVGTADVHVPLDSRDDLGGSDLEKWEYVGSIRTCGCPPRRGFCVQFRVARRREGRRRPAEETVQGNGLGVGPQWGHEGARTGPDSRVGREVPSPPCRSWPTAQMIHRSRKSDGIRLKKSPRSEVFWTVCTEFPALLEGCPELGRGGGFVETGRWPTPRCRPQRHVRWGSANLSVGPG